MRYTIFSSKKVSNSEHSTNESLHKTECNDLGWYEEELKRSGHTIRHVAMNEQGNMNAARKGRLR
jgi:hypothetical protein